MVIMNLDISHYVEMLRCINRPLLSLLSTWIGHTTWDATLYKSTVVIVIMNLDRSHQPVEMPRCINRLLLSLLWTRGSNAFSRGQAHTGFGGRWGRHHLTFPLARAANGIGGPGINSSPSSRHARQPRRVPVIPDSRLTSCNTIQHNCFAKCRYSCTRNVFLCVCGFFFFVVPSALVHSRQAQNIINLQQQETSSIRVQSHL